MKGFKPACMYSACGGTQDISCYKPSWSNVTEIFRKRSTLEGLVGISLDLLDQKSLEVKCLLNTVNDCREYMILYWGVRYQCIKSTGMTLVQDWYDCSCTLCVGCKFRVKCAKQEVHVLNHSLGSVHTTCT